ncbi:MAG: hypothetical protein Q8906_08260 [Bacillota bacterium]|nr:hypothetical protein [Bacillota bacterium]MDP4170590.1 hypothetical protein [Bacillota bacterium]
MGYIAPVNHYQYAAYQEREIGSDYDPFKIIAIEKTKPIQKRGYLMHNEEITKQIYSIEATRPNRGKKVYGSPQVEKVYGEMTGKGRLFSESV